LFNTKVARTLPCKVNQSIGIWFRHVFCNFFNVPDLI
jgi:hypothetical protein